MYVYIYIYIYCFLSDSIITFVSCSGLAHGHRHPKNGIGTQAVLVVRPVQLEHDLVNLDLLHGIKALLDQLRSNHVVDVVDRLGKIKN